MQYYAVNTSSGLSHHGILGMKWGIRRFQNADGTLTAAGKERYGSKENFENSDYYKKYRAKQLAKEGKNPDGTQKSKEQLQVERNKKIARNVAIGAGIAAAAIAGGILYKKWADENKDLIIKGGEAMQRISNNNEIGLHDEFYAAFGKHDIKRYAQKLPKHFKDVEDKKRYARIFEPNNPALKEATGFSVKKLKAVDDIKIASLGSAKKVFKEMQKSNKNLQGVDFDSFNYELAGNHSDPTVKKFYQALKDKGYDGLVDVNDKKYSGYYANNPAIIFNKGKVAIESVITKNFSDVDVEALNSKAKFGQQIDAAKPTIAKYTAAGAGFIGLSGASSYVSLVNEEKKLKKQKRSK